MGLGLGFVLGFFTGSWSIRRIGFAIRVKETQPEAVSKKQRPKVGWGLPEDGDIGAENPLGPPPPSPRDFVKRNPRGWLDDLPSIQAGR